MTTESALAGIADTVITGSRLPREHLEVLSKRVLFNGTQFALADGTTVDLCNAPALLQHAGLLEEIRELSWRLSEK